jgi:hypothetical protein
MGAPFIGYMSAPLKAVTLSCACKKPIKKHNRRVNKFFFIIEVV